MARNRTLTEMITDVRERSGLRGGQPTDATITAFINAAIAWVWQALSDTGWGYTLAESDVTCTADVATVSLPANFAAMRHVRRPTTGTDTGYQRAEFLDPSVYYSMDPDDIGQWIRPGRYWYSQGNLRLVPIPESAEVVKLVFEVVPPELSDPADVYDAVVATDEPVIWYAVALAVPDKGERMQMMALAEQLKTDAVKRLRPRDRQAQRVRGRR